MFSGFVPDDVASITLDEVDSLKDPVSLIPLQKCVWGSPVIWMLDVFSDRGNCRAQGSMLTGWAVWPCSLFWGYRAAKGSGRHVKPWTATLKADLEIMLDPTVFGRRLWKRDCLAMSCETAFMDRWRFGAAIRDVVKTRDKASKTRPRTTLHAQGGPQGGWLPTGLAVFVPENVPTPFFLYNFRIDIKPRGCRKQSTKNTTNSRLSTFSENPGYFAKKESSIQQCTEFRVNSSMMKSPRTSNSCIIHNKTTRFEMHIWLFKNKQVQPGSMKKSIISHKLFKRLLYDKLQTQILSQTLKKCFDSK